MIEEFLNFFSDIDAFAMIMLVLVIFIGVCVFSFASRYMRGDTKYHLFCIRLILLIFSVSVTISADNLIILFFSWCLSNTLLVFLMIHKSNWKAARASGMIALKNYLLGALCLGTAFTIFYLVTGEKNVKAILNHDAESIPILLSLILMLIGAMTQSAIWPFHRWLNSSLNSPTPVSAIMHAGLVNGGGLILVRFAPLYLQYPSLLTVIFIIGITTALIGILWKLMQSDVKRMLAASTMGQMGFMLAQCGLGLFPAAVAHLVWHGMFKSYLFLASGSAAQEKRFDLGYPPNFFTFICALLCGVVGSIGFGYASGKSWLANDSTLVLMVVSLLASTQLVIPIMRDKSKKVLLLALVSTLLAGLAYGGSVQLITGTMKSMNLMVPQPLNVFHIIGIIALTSTWIWILFIRNQDRAAYFSQFALKYYVAALNSSQPHASTITAYRNHYKYQ